MEMLRALGALIAPPSDALGPVAAALHLGPLPEPSEYTDLFALQLAPYASVYLNGDGMLGGAARDRIEGFLRALGMDAMSECDHLGALLGVYAGLQETEVSTSNRRHRELARRARTALLHEHILCWVPSYLDAIDRVATEASFYRRWSRLLRRGLASAAADAAPPSPLALHLRRAPALPDPRHADAKSFLEGLLAPVVSGLILTRDDFARCARDLDIGMRKGERRFVLRALLGQDDAAVLAWLGSEATRQGSRHAAGGDAHQRHWHRRADTTSTLLRSLAASART